MRWHPIQPFLAAVAQVVVLAFDSGPGPRPLGLVVAVETDLGPVVGLDPVVNLVAAVVVGSGPCWGLVVGSGPAASVC